MESSDDETKKILQEIERLMLESKKLDAEALRRQQVAQMKVYGWLIEWVQSQRDKLTKEENKPMVASSSENNRFANTSND